MIINDSMYVRLGSVAHARSGDKGNRANIGVIANSPQAFAHLQACLTPETVERFLRPMGLGLVTRYELPRIHAFNFVIENALAGGASRSLRIDTQGKALGTVLLEMPVPPLLEQEVADE